MASASCRRHELWSMEMGAARERKTVNDLPARWQPVAPGTSALYALRFLDGVCIALSGIIAGYLVPYQARPTGPLFVTSMLVLLLSENTAYRTIYEAVSLSGYCHAVLRLGLSLLLLATVFYAGGEPAVAAIWPFPMLVILILLFSLQRILLAPVVRHGLKSGLMTRNVVVYGAGPEGRQVVQDLLQGKDHITKRIALVDSRRERVPFAVEDVPVYRGIASLPEFLMRVGCRELIIALPLTAAGRVRSLCSVIKGLPISVRLAGVDYANYGGHLSGAPTIPLFDLMDRPLDDSQWVRKRFIDVVASLIFLLVLSPIMVFLAIAIKLDSPGPILFRQRREGFGRTEFDVIKFRTLRHNNSDPLCLKQVSETDQRVTRLGRVLRRLGLDELPQLLNVLRGDMSLVGPRPHAIGMLVHGQSNAELASEYISRLTVKPGITGWAQVNGNRGPIDRAAMLKSRVALDLFYVQNQSDFLDMKIVMMTAVQLLKDIMVTLYNFAVVRLAGRAAAERPKFARPADAE